MGRLFARLSALCWLACPRDCSSTLPTGRLQIGRQDRGQLGHKTAHDYLKLFHPPKVGPKSPPSRYLSLIPAGRPPDKRLCVLALCAHNPQLTSSSGNCSPNEQSSSPPTPMDFRAVFSRFSARLWPFLSRRARVFARLCGRQTVSDPAGRSSRARRQTGRRVGVSFGRPSGWCTRETVSRAETMARLELGRPARLAE